MSEYNVLPRLDPPTTITRASIFAFFSLLQILIKNLIFRMLVTSLFEESSFNVLLIDGGLSLPNHRAVCAKSENMTFDFVGDEP
jgi:hypothetical protein